MIYQLSIATEACKAVARNATVGIASSALSIEGWNLGMACCWQGMNVLQSLALNQLLKTSIGMNVLKHMSWNKSFGINVLKHMFWNECLGINNSKHRLE